MWRSARRLIAASGVLIGMVSVAAAQPFAYVTNTIDDTVSMINTETLAVVATIPVEAGARKLAVAPDGRWVYATNSLAPGPEVISVISTAERRVVQQIELGLVTPDDIVVSPSGSFLYVTDRSAHILGLQEPPGGFVVAVWLRSPYTPVGFSLPDIPGPLAFAPDGSVLYAAAGSGIFAIDPFIGTVLRFIEAAGSPQDMVVAPDGALAYVADTDQRFGRTPGVHVIDLVAGVRLDTIAVPQPDVIALAPDASTAYVTVVGRDGPVYVIDTASRRVADTIPGGIYLAGVAVAPDGSKLFVVEAGDVDGTGNLRVIDPATHALITTVPLGRRPVHIALGGTVGRTPTATTVVVTPPTSPTSTPPPDDPCPGDCDDDDQVTVDEVVTAVRIARDAELMDACPPCDVNRDRHVTVDELVAAVRSALTGCAR
jgi:YVTN family beta-propeller protein